MIKHPVEVLASEMVDRFLSIFDREMMIWAVNPAKRDSLNNPEIVTKAATKAIFQLEKVVRDAGKGFSSTFDETMNKLKNGQQV